MYWNLFYLLTGDVLEAVSVLAAAYTTRCSQYTSVNMFSSMFRLIENN
jgi:hypothetical protein